jgi:hypothetical protein
MGERIQAVLQWVLHSHVEERSQALADALQQSEPFQSFLLANFPSLGVRNESRPKDGALVSGDSFLLLPGLAGRDESGQGATSEAKVAEGGPSLLWRMCEEVLLESDVMFWVERAETASRLLGGTAQGRVKEAVEKLRRCGERKQDLVRAQLRLLSVLVTRVISQIPDDVSLCLHGGRASQTALCACEQCESQDLRT